MLSARMEFLKMEIVLLMLSRLKCGVLCHRFICSVSASTVLDGPDCFSWRNGLRMKVMIPRKALDARYVVGVWHGRNQLTGAMVWTPDIHPVSENDYWKLEFNIFGREATQDRHSNWKGLNSFGCVF